VEAGVYTITVRVVSFWRSGLLIGPMGKSVVCVGE